MITQQQFRYIHLLHQRYSKTKEEIANRVGTTVEEVTNILARTTYPDHLDAMRRTALRELKWAQRQPDASCFVSAVEANWQDYMPKWAPQDTEVAAQDAT